MLEEIKSTYLIALKIDFENDKYGSLLKFKDGEYYMTDDEIRGLDWFYRENLEKWDTW